MIIGVGALDIVCVVGCDKPKTVFFCQLDERFVGFMLIGYLVILYLYEKVVFAEDIDELL